MKRTVAASERAYRRHRSLKTLCSILLEGFFIALLVGLLVNQATDVITYLKTGQQDAPYHTTAWIISILLFMLILLAAYHLARALLRSGERGEVGDEPNSSQ